VTTLLERAIEAAARDILEGTEKIIWKRTLTDDDRVDQVVGRIGKGTILLERKTYLKVDELEGINTEQQIYKCQILLIDDSDGRADAWTQAHNYAPQATHQVELRELYEAVTWLLSDLPSRQIKLQALRDFYKALLG
jgi:hypothetical protein